MSTSEAPALLDANILVYADQAQDEHHEAARAIRDLGQSGALSLCVTPQVLNEYFAVVTNPRRVTRPLPPAEAMAEVEKYVRSRHIRKLYPGPGVHDRLRELFQHHPVTGPDIFDLYLIATMLENGVRQIYTFNGVACHQIRQGTRMVLYSPGVGDCRRRIEPTSRVGTGLVKRQRAGLSACLCPACGLSNHTQQ